MILRNFLNTEGGLYFWRREFRIGDVKATKPENLFLEDDLYTIIDDDGGRDVSIEIGFAKLESVGAPFIATILDNVRIGQTPILSENASEFLAHFHYYSAKRSAAWHRRFVGRDEVLAVVKKIAQEPRWTEEQRAWMWDTPDLDRVMNNARIAAQGTGPTDELLALMRKRGMAIYLAPKGASFILGDHPTAMANVGAGIRTATGKVTFMPIAFDVAIGYTHTPRKVHIEPLTRSQIRAMNEAMARQSTMIAGRSDSLIRSLSKLGYQMPEYFTSPEYLQGPMI